MVGSVRNYIAKLGRENLLKSKTDYVGNNFMDLAFQAVEGVHGNTNAMISDRSIILTIYITMLEWKTVEVSEKELGRIVGLAMKGLNF